MASIFIIPVKLFAVRCTYDAIKHVIFVVGPIVRFHIDTRDFARLSIEFRSALEIELRSSVSLVHLFIACGRRAASRPVEGEKLFSMDRYLPATNALQSCNRRCRNIAGMR